MLKRRLIGDRYFLPAGERLTGAQSFEILGQLSGGAFSVGYRARAETRLVDAIFHEVGAWRAPDTPVAVTCT